jgi:hypothetical protein
MGVERLRLTATGRQCAADGGRIIRFLAETGMRQGHHPACSGIPRPIVTENRIATIISCPRWPCPEPSVFRYTWAGISLTGLVGLGRSARSRWTRNEPMRNILSGLERRLSAGHVHHLIYVNA